jgi:MscS family membrane protein
MDRRPIKAITRLSALFAASLMLYGQAAPAPQTDPLGRDNPQAAILHFLEASHTHDYQKASHYLDLRRIPMEDRGKGGIEVTKQLEDLLDDIPSFDIAKLSRDPEGDSEEDVPDQFQHITTYKVKGRTIDLQLQHVEVRPGLKVWLVSAGSVMLIPLAHQMISETPFEHDLPRFLVTHELFDTPIWKWLGLLVMAIAGWFVTGTMAWAIARAAKRVNGLENLKTPVWACLWMTTLWIAVVISPPSTLARLFLDRAIALFFFLGLAGIGAVMVDLIALRWSRRLDPRAQAVSFSVLPLGRQIVKLMLLLAVLLSVVSSWGYNTSTILAGLGVGGLAVALAAQKTIENLFGGISVIGDRPVLVGDACRFGDKTGTVMHIGLRSTRVRTADRTIISVPNAQFSTMSLENLSSRDKYFFHPTLNLRRDTTQSQMSDVLASVKEILTTTPKVEAGGIPVRFTGIGQYSLDVEVAVYLTCANDEEFLRLQQELLMKLLAAIEKAGTALAVPLQEAFKLDSGRA